MALNSSRILPFFRNPASGFVPPLLALAIGLIAGVFCFQMVSRVKKWFRYDDSLDAFGVHGDGGTLGAPLTGVFAASAIHPIFGKDANANQPPAGAIEGNRHQLLNQPVGIAIAWDISIAGTLAIFWVDKTLGLRVSAEDEAIGLDLSQHREEGCDFGS